MTSLSLHFVRPARSTGQVRCLRRFTPLASEANLRVEFDVCILNAYGKHHHHVHNNVTMAMASCSAGHDRDESINIAIHC
jgi:hypothetical protein